MVDKIKLDGGVSLINLKNENKTSTKTNPLAKTEKIQNNVEVKITNSLLESQPIENSAKIQSLKERIQNNTYHIDIDRLSSKLIHSMIGMKAG